MHGVSLAGEGERPLVRGTTIRRMSRRGAGTGGLVELTGEERENTNLLNWFFAGFLFLIVATLIQHLFGGGGGGVGVLVAEVEVLARDAFVHVQHVTHRGLEVRGGVVPAADEGGVLFAIPNGHHDVAHVYKLLIDVPLWARGFRVQDSGLRVQVSRSTL